MCQFNIFAGQILAASEHGTHAQHFFGVEIFPSDYGVEIGATTEPLDGSLWTGELERRGKLNALNIVGVFCNPSWCTLCHIIPYV